MILSAPVADDDQQEQEETLAHESREAPPYPSPYPSPYAPSYRQSPPPPARRWNSDEVECAVSILHDFQAPLPGVRTERYPVEQGAAETDVPYSDEPQREPRARYDGASEGENDEEQEQEQEQEIKPSSSGGLWGSQDVMSKLDLLVQADAAIETGRAPSPAPPSKMKTKTQRAMDTKTTAALRSGVWTRAEEEYAAALMYYFLRGELGPEVVREGTTLRKFLADMLGCNRRRVSMKLATEAIAGRKVPRKVGASVFVAARPQVARGRSEHEPEHVHEDHGHEDEEASAMRATLVELRRRCFRDRESDRDDLHRHHHASHHHHSSSSSSHHAAHDNANDHYPPYHGEQLEEILDRPPQCGDESPDATPIGSGATSDDEELPHSRRRVRKSVAPFSPSGPPPPHRSTSSRLKIRKDKKGKTHPTIIRTGFESQEEDEYVTSMVEFFLDGALALPLGTPLVGYLCDQLQCTPRALSLKLAPRRHGERRFPDNMDAITFVPRFRASGSSPSAVKTVKGETWEEMASDDDVADEVFEVESRLRELRVACLEAHDQSQSQSQPNGSSAEAVRSTPRSASLAHSHSQPPPRSSPQRGGRANARSATAASTPRTFSRSGAWSREEEEFTAALIDRFFKGTLEIAEGTTLRAFLASKLQCNPMRVSKKLASECIADVKIPKKLGSSTFVRQRHADAAVGDEGGANLHHEAGDVSLHELERAYQRVDSAKHLAVAGLKSPSMRGRRRKLPLSLSLSPLALSPSSPLSSRTQLDSDDEQRRSPHPRDRYASPSSEEEEDGQVSGKARRTDYSRSPAAEVARQMRQEHVKSIATEQAGDVEGTDGGAAAFEARIVPLTLREQFA